jgi:hypothetical protein
MRINHLLVFLLFFVFVGGASAEDLSTLFQRVNQYSSSGNYTKALEELAWARKEIEKMHMTKLTSLLPESIAGHTGQPTKSEGALGFTSVNRIYSKGNSQIELSISGSSSMSGGPMGGLAGLGRMAAMMANTPGNETFRIDGRTANLEMAGSNSSLTVFLNSGSILKLQGRGTNADTLKEAARGINIGNIDSYLSGQKN